MLLRSLNHTLGDRVFLCWNLLSNNFQGEGNRYTLEHDEVKSVGP